MAVMVPNTKITTRSVIFVISLLLLAVMMRGLKASPDACISKDGAWFIEMAHKLDDDPVRHMQIETKQPGLSWVYLAVGRITGHVSPATTPIQWQSLGVWIAIICGGAITLLMFDLTRRLFDVATALIATVFAALWPQGVMLSADALSDMPHLMMYLSVILAVAIVGTTKQKRAVELTCLFGAGALGGLAYWIRLEAIGLLPAIACWLLWMPGKKWPSRLMQAGSFMVGFLVPFLAFAAITGRLLFVKTPTLTELDAETAYPIWHWAHTFPFWQTPGRIIEAWAKSGRYVFSSLFVLAILWKSVPRGESKLMRLCALAIGWHLLLVVARISMHGDLSSRYLVIPAALTIPWAAAGYMSLVQQLTLRFNPTRSSSRTLPVIGTIGLFVVAAPMAPYWLRPINSTRMPYRAAGLWLADHAEKDDVVFAADADLKQVQFYAGRMYPNDENWRLGSIDDAKAAHPTHATRWWISHVGSPDNDATVTSENFDHVFSDKDRNGGKRIGVIQIGS